VKLQAVAPMIADGPPFLKRVRAHIERAITGYM
jgi:hypothetical protein